MPYIITTKPSMLHSHIDTPGVTRTAVATLEEMRQKAFGAIDRASKMDRDMNSDEQRADRGFRLAVRFDLDDGGTVGPLPDGTVIEVQRVLWSALERDGGTFYPVPENHAADIIAAFNAVQA